MEENDVHSEKVSPSSLKTTQLSVLVLIMDGREALTWYQSRIEVLYHAGNLLDLPRRILRPKDITLKLLGRSILEPLISVEGTV